MSALLFLVTGCASVHATPPGPTAPVSFAHSTAEAQVTRTIDVRDGLTKAQAFKIVTDALSAHFTVDVTDPRVGFAMTAWQATIRDGVPDPRYRTRVTVRFQGDDWKRLQVRDEANLARGEEWDVGYDAMQLDSVVYDLRAKIGRRP
jgi:hypothetical protein